MKELRSRLSKAGIKRKFLDEIVLPSWWEDSIAVSPGGFREAAGVICGHLGFGLKNLLVEGQELSLPKRSGVKFKKSKGVSEDDVCLATHFALGLARSVANALADAPTAQAVPSPEEWRQRLLAESDRPWVCLRHIVDASWKLGIPVIHVTNPPTGAKKPTALTTMIGDRPVILVLNGRKSPSWVAYYVAHELGHIHHKHLKAGETLVDEKIDERSEEKEEVQANEYAAQLLTGHSNLGLHSTRPLKASNLAAQAKTFGENYKVAPGVAALNYGFTTGFWAVANGAVSALEKADDAGLEIQEAMLANLDADDFSEDTWEWLTRATCSAE